MSKVGSFCISGSAFQASDSSTSECAVRHFVSTSTCNSLNRLTSFPILLERDALLSCYETEEMSRGRVISMKKKNTNHFSLFQLGDMLLEYQPPFGLDLGLLPDGMLGEELVGGGERRVMMNVRVPFE